MKLSINNSKKNETANAAKQHVNNSVEVHEVDVIGMMTSLKQNGHAKLSDHFKDAEVVEPVSETPAAPAPKAGKKPVAVKHKVTPKPKAAPAPKAATYSVQEYTTKKGKTAYLLFGFETKEQAENIAAQCSKTISASWRTGENGEKRYCLSMGTRYGDIAKAMCDALNAKDGTALATAMADSCKVYEQAVADGKAAREEKKAERKAAKEAEAKAAATIAKAAQKAAPKAKPKAYSEADVAAMLSAIAEGKAIPAPIRKLMKAA